MTIKSNRHGEITLVGDITSDDILNLEEILASDNITNSSTIKLNITTHGGTAAAAFTMVHMLLATGKKINTHVQAYCCSSGLLLLMVGETRTMDASSQCYIHDFQVSNSFKDLNRVQKELDYTVSLRAQYITFLAARTGLTEKQVQQMMISDLTLSSQTCLELNFVNRVNTLVASENSLSSQYIFFDISIKSIKPSSKEHSPVKEKTK